MKTAVIILLLMGTLSSNVFSQSGTYLLKYKNGASCTIAITQSHKQIQGDVFAWWHTASGKQGAFSGRGNLKGNACTLISTDDPDCKIELSFGQNNLNAIFNDCINSNLPEDFSGKFKKLTNHLPATYKVAVNKARFYKAAGYGSPLKSYLLQGDLVTVDLENIYDDSWVYINFKNAKGKVTSGFMPWNVLKLN